MSPNTRRGCLRAEHLVRGSSDRQRLSLARDQVRCRVRRSSRPEFAEPWVLGTSLDEPEDDTVGGARRCLTHARIPSPRPYGEKVRMRGSAISGRAANERPDATLQLCKHHGARSCPSRSVEDTPPACPSPLHGEAMLRMDEETGRGDKGATPEWRLVPDKKAPGNAPALCVWCPCPAVSWTWAGSSGRLGSCRAGT